MAKSNKKEEKSDKILGKLEKCADDLNKLEAKLRSEESSSPNIPYRFKMLLEITKGISTILNLEHLLVSVVDAAIDLVDADRGFLMLRSEEGKLQIVVARDKLGNNIINEKFKVSTSIIDNVIRNRKPLFVDNIKQDERFSNKSSVVELKLYSAICVPLITSRGQNIHELIGLLYVDSSSVTAPLSHEDIDLLLAFAGQVAISIENVRLYELSIEDSLTKIYNRDYLERRFEEELNRAQRYNHDLSVLMIDVDNLKIVNDRFGHHMGDKILQEIALHLKKRMRGCDILARYGGDEFVAVLPETSKEDAQVIAEALRTIVAKQMRAADFTLTISIGIASYPRDIVEKPAEMKLALLEKADRALYQAKNEGKNRVSQFRISEEKHYLRSDYFIQREIRTLRREDTQKLLEIATRINSILKLSDLLNTILDYGLELVRGEKARIALLDQDDKVSHDVRKTSAQKSISQEDIKASEIFITKVRTDGLPLLVSEVKNDAQYKDEKVVIDQDVKSILCVPIHSGGRILGIIYVENRQPTGNFTEGNLKLLMTFANLSAQAVENALLFTKISEKEK